MSILDALRETLRLLNAVEIKGEGNIAAMREAIACLKGMICAFERTKEDQHDHHDQQG